MILEDVGLHIDFVLLYISITYAAFLFYPKIHMTTR